MTQTLISEKQCSKCHAVKPYAEFSPHKLGLGGVRSICKPCSSQQVMDARRRRPESRNAARRANRNWRESPKGRAHKVESNRRMAQKHPAKYLWLRAKNRARRKGIPFTITVDDVVVPTHCPILGIELVVARKSFRDPGFGGNECSMSLDRLRPELGYVPGNVAVISWRANRIKGAASVEELDRVAQWLRAQLVAQSAADESP